MLILIKTNSVHSNEGAGKELLEKNFFFHFGQCGVE